MGDHCHECGKDSALDECASVCAHVVMTEDEDLTDVRRQAREFLSAYITRRHNALVGNSLPRIS